MIQLAHIVEQNQIFTDARVLNNYFVDFVDVLFIKSIFITTDEMKKRPKTKRKKIRLKIKFI